MKDKVKILFFKGDTPECELCDQIEQLLKELSEIDNRIEYSILDYEKDGSKYNVNSAPVILFKNKPNIRFLGIPSGYEFSAFLEDIIHVSRNEVHLDLATAKKIAKINKNINIKVFVTPTCPYCPQAVHTAHMFAFVNPKIKSEMVEALEYRELATKHNVMAVPKVVINDKVEFEGAVPENVFLDFILKATQNN